MRYFLLKIFVSCATQIIFQNVIKSSFFHLSSGRFGKLETVKKKQENLTLLVLKVVAITY